MRIPRPIGITFGGLGPGLTPVVDVRFEIADLQHSEYREFVEQVLGATARPDNNEDGS